MNDERSVIEQALDLFVYAPVGFALEVKDMLPKLADRGRGQITLARLAGRVAAQKGRGEVERIMDDLRASSNGVDSDLVADDDEDAPQPQLEVIDDYDGLTAPEVLPHLERLSQTDLEDVLTYEQHHRARATVINRIRQLRA